MKNREAVLLKERLLCCYIIENITICKWRLTEAKYE